MPAPVLLVPAASNLLEAIIENDAFGRICLIALTLMSMASIFLIVVKAHTLKIARQQSLAFKELADNEGSWESLFVAAKQYPESPLAILFREIYIECRLEKWFSDHDQLQLEGRIGLAKETISSIVDRVMASQEEHLHSRLSLLALVTTLAPFIGLLGTVWGILIVFIAISAGGSASLSTLAPGISTALVTTIFGLFAAIPAVVAHHWLSGKAQNLATMTEMFSRDIENAVRKQISRERGVPK